MFQENTSFSWWRQDAHIAKTIDTRWGSDNHPHSFSNGISLRSSLWWIISFLQMTHEQGAWFSTLNSIFRDCLPTSRPWIGDYASLITPITGEIASSWPFRWNAKELFGEQLFSVPLPSIFRNVIRRQWSWFQSLMAIVEQLQSWLAFMQQRN